MGFGEVAVGEGTGEFDCISLYDGFARYGERLGGDEIVLGAWDRSTGEAMGVNKEADLDGGPARCVTVGHFDGDTHLFFVVRDTVERLLVAIEHIVGVVCAVDEKNGDAAVR